jgi:hypothetical protein
MSDPTEIPLIPDPEGKHLQVCRIQLAKILSERNQFQSAIIKFRDAKGRFHTQKAAEELIALAETLK